MFKKLKQLKSIQLIPIFFTLFAISYFNYAVLNWYAIHSLNHVVSLFDKGRSYELFKHYPMYPGIVLVGIMAGFLFLYLALKIQSLSKQIWWFGIISLLIVPDIVAVLVGEVFGNAYFIRFKPGVQVQFLPEISNLFPWLIEYFTKNFIRITTIVLLLVNYKKFTKPSQSLSNKIRVIFFPMLITMPLLYLGYVCFGLIKAYETDYGYTQVQNQTPFHIYRPTYLPGKISQASEVQTNVELGPYTNAIRTIYDTSFFDRDEQDLEKPNGTVLIFQTQSDINFDIEKMTREAIKSDIEEYKKIEMNNAKNKSGYIRKTNNQNSMNVLNFLTQDNVLIQVITIHLPLEETIKVAEFLH